ncbi:undecaprenyl diphosphate synthase family protein [Desulfosporosinus sp. FKA]|uniref:undecaprenyl diphosphate synthase family protein n=1 Tax=Desulfosporosinus sp. FKA TaxID=1969834 RepID=UPI00249E532A|nr:undecaprenyl diphosphate synthase family protein [Desulfosporosinus sp. FKA]
MELQSCSEQCNPPSWCSSCRIKSPPTKNLFGGYLWTKDQVDPDLLIRTSGEKRVSNFLLWQLSKTQIWTANVLWPDFTSEHLLEAINSYWSQGY